MGNVIIADHAHLFFSGDGLVDRAEMDQPFVIPVPLLAKAQTPLDHDNARATVERGRWPEAAPSCRKEHPKDASY
jgi:hypothetical protein